MSDRVAAEAFPPGEYLKDELDERGWKQGEFAGIIGRSAAVVNQIISGKRGITPEIAADLGAALGTSATYWMNLDTAFRLWHVQRAEARLARIRQEAHIRERFPVREMVKRGWIEKTDNPEILQSQLLRFSKLRSIDDRLSFDHAARKTAYTNPLTYVQEAWLWRVRQIADAMPTGEYREQALRSRLPALHALLSDPEETRHVPRIMAEAGVRLVVVEALPGSKIDAVCFWLNAKAPVIGMSLRYDRIDNFWFVLRHEIEHVLRRDGFGEPVGMVDAELSPSGATANDALPPEEAAANGAAAEFCVPQDQFADWISRVRPMYSEERLLSFAASLDIHPGLVAGQLQRRLNKWDLFRKHLAKVRHIVARVAMTDGFGQVHPVTI